MFWTIEILGLLLLPALLPPAWLFIGMALVLLIIPFVLLAVYWKYPHWGQ